MEKLEELHPLNQIGYYFFIIKIICIFDEQKKDLTL